MTDTVTKILDQIRHLSHEEKDLFSMRFQYELEAEDYDPFKDSEFLSELERRIEAVDRGMDKLIDGDRAFELARLDLNQRRLAAHV
jgi:hypothetical protein